MVEKMETLKAINAFIEQNQYIINTIVALLGVIATSLAAIIALRLGSFKRKIKMNVLCLKAAKNGKMYFALEIHNTGERDIEIMPSSFGIKSKNGCGHMLPLIEYPSTISNHFDVLLTISPLKKKLLYCIEDKDFSSTINAGLDGAKKANDLFIFYDSPLRERMLYKIKNKAILNWLDNELFNIQSKQKSITIPFTDIRISIKTKATKYLGD